MIKEDSVSPESDISGDFSKSLTMFLTEVEDETERSSEFPIQEEKIEEIMQELYKEITCSSCINVNLTSPLSNIASTSPSPSSSSLSLSSPPFDGKSESCGASISDSGSTVMAGIEFVALTGNIENGKVGLSENGSWMVGLECNGVGVKMDGCDVLEVGDEWLARVLGWGPPLELEEWT